MMCGMAMQEVDASSGVKKRRPEPEASGFKKTKAKVHTNGSKLDPIQQRKQREFFRS
jgi:hypothetical protein